SSHVIRPKDPPGFEVLIFLEETETLVPEHVYLVAIALVADWGYKGWDHKYRPRSPTRTKEGYGLKVDWRCLAYPDDKYQLKSSYLILGMLHLIHQMTQEEFSPGTAAVAIGKDSLGYIEIMLPRPGHRIGAPGKDNSTIEPRGSSGNITERADPTATRRIPDPKDPDLVIVYQVKGEPLTCVQVFSTILYAVATAAQGPNDEFCQDLAGFNEERSVVFQIHGLEETASRNLLYYETVRRGLVLLADRLSTRATCGELKFRYEYRGELLGSATIQLSDYARGTER
ncbi:MAG: hypothetical protein Q9196_007333, partial [Gyalolechia fulgens]